MPKRVIEHGAEIEFTDDRDNTAAQRVTIHDSGWAEVIYEYQYELKFYPPHKIETIHTHTTDEMEAEFLEDDGDE